MYQLPQNETVRNGKKQLWRRKQILVFISHFILFVCFQSAQSLHGDIPQKQREITLKGFRNGAFEVLVATNVAARGLDIPEVDLVVQCSPPKVWRAAINQ